MTIGMKIKQARIAHGWTQEELGNRIGVQKSAIAKWETGRVENIKRTSLVALAEALEISPADLIGRSEQKDISPTKAKLIDMVSDMDEAQLKEVMRYIQFVKQS